MARVSAVKDGPLPRGTPVPWGRLGAPPPWARPKPKPIRPQHFLLLLCLGAHRDAALPPPSVTLSLERPWDGSSPTPSGEAGGLPTGAQDHNCMAFEPCTQVACEPLASGLAANCYVGVRREPFLELVRALPLQFPEQGRAAPLCRRNPTYTYHIPYHMYVYMHIQVFYCRERSGTGFAGFAAVPAVRHHIHIQVPGGATMNTYKYMYICIHIDNSPNPFPPSPRPIPIPRFSWIFHLPLPPLDPLRPVNANFTILRLRNRCRVMDHRCK